MNRGEIELLIKDEVQRLFDHFARCFEVRILFTTPDGREVRVGLDQPDSAYCRCVHRLVGEEACLALDETKRQQAAARREMIRYRCHAGLVEAMKPVYFQERLLGFVVIGQFRSSAGMPVHIESEWNERFGTDDISRCFSRLPCISTGRIDGVLGLFSALVDYIVARQMIGLGGNGDVARILAYMREHLHEDISLDEVAGLIGKSRSTVSHLFKRHTGRSFKRTLVEMKLDDAERLLVADPALSIREAAARVGYADSLYFSRLYKRIRGIAPSGVR